MLKFILFLKHYFSYQVNLNLLDPFFRFKSNETKLKIILNKANEKSKYKTIIPGLLLPEEKRLLHILAKDYYEGLGTIFDAGIFFGCCTASFNSGLIENKIIEDKKNRIWAYELGKFVKNSFYDASIQDYSGGLKPEGNDFTKIIESYINNLPQRENIKLIFGDITEQEYPDKIEIMFLDCCKCNYVNFAMQKLFNKMIPGKSVLIQQDYIHNFEPYIRATMGYLKDYFEFIGVTPVGSAVFLFKKKISEEVLKINPYDEFDLDTVIDLHNYFNKYLNKEQVKLITEAVEIIKKDKSG